MDATAATAILRMIGLWGLVMGLFLVPDLVIRGRAHVRAWGVRYAVFGCCMLTLMVTVPVLAGLFSPNTSPIAWVVMLASLSLAGLFAVKEVANAGKRGRTGTWGTTNLAVRLWMVAAVVMAPVVAAWGVLAL